MRKIFFVIASIGLLTSACKHSHDHDHDHDLEAQSTVKAQEEGTESFLDAIVFSEAQSRKIDFAVSLPVMQEDFGQIIKTTAQIQSSQADEQVVSALTGGIVVMGSDVLTEGKNVAAGQTLFTVSGAGIADNNASVRFVEAESNYRKAKADYERAQELVEEKIVSDKDFLQIKGTYETCKAVYENLHRNFTASGQRVTSPGAGYVKQLFVTNGQYVSEGQPLVSISKNKTLLVKADVRAKYASVLPYIVSATIKDKNISYSLKDLNGRLLSYGKSLTDENYTIPVVFQVDNKTGLIPGSFVEIYIRTKTEKPVLTLPNKALTEDQGVFFVFVQIAPGHYEKREVQTGVTDGLSMEIISGISDKEKIVTKGAISVKLAQSSGALDSHAGHVH